MVAEAPARLLRFHFTGTDAELSPFVAHGETLIRAQVVTSIRASDLIDLWRKRGHRKTC